MPTSTVRLIIAAALFVHGVGHTLGFWMPTRSWLFPNRAEPVLRAVSSLLWVLAAAGFVAASLGFLAFLVPASAWRPPAVGFAGVSWWG